MSIAISTGVGLAIAGVGAAAGAGIGALSSISAANTQANAANNATTLQAQEAQNALNFQEQQLNTEQQNEQPWLQAGQGAVQTLSGLIPQLNAQDAAYPQFQAPTAAQAQQTPGYQFALQQGLLGVQNSAAARGDLLSGNTLAATEQYGQGLADQTYQQTYNNSFNQYQQQYQQFQNSQANQFNRYATVAGLGQTAAGQSASAGQAAAGNVANISLGTGAQQGQSLQNAAAATASGYVGAGNAITGGLNSLGQYATLSGLLGQSGVNPPIGSYTNPGIYEPEYTG